MGSDLDFSNLVKIDNSLNILCNSYEALAKSCIETYGEQIIRYNPERIICLTIGSWHWDTDDPLWQTHYPAEIEPDLNQTVPISTNEIFNRIGLNVYIRLKCLPQFVQKRRFNLFMNICHPASLFSLGATNGTPERTVKYLDFICYKLYHNALRNLGVKYLDMYDETVDCDSFLKFNYILKFADLHTNIKYGEYIWSQIINFLNKYNWDKNNFASDNDKLNKYVIK
jgi:hypothetical protein